MLSWLLAGPRGGGPLLRGAQRRAGSCRWCRAPSPRARCRRSRARPSRAGRSVRRRTAATLALVGGAGGGRARARRGAGRRPAARAGLRARGLRRRRRACCGVLSAAVPALFLNALLVAALIAAGRASWLPRLTGGARGRWPSPWPSSSSRALGPRGAALGLVGRRVAAPRRSPPSACRRASLRGPGPAAARLGARGLRADGAGRERRERQPRPRRPGRGPELGGHAGRRLEAAAGVARGLVGDLRYP